jgi:hypothetical protein
MLVKEYETKPNVDDLIEVFAVIYVLDLPKWEVKNETDGVEYVFFTSLEKAFKRFKVEGPRKSILKRILTDNEELVELARRNDNVEIPEDDGEEVEIPEQTEQSDIQVLKPISIPPREGDIEA